MDKNDALKIAKKYLKNISTKYIIEKAVLFGSFAKGTNNADSDIDIAIIIRNVTDIIETQIDLMKLRADDDLLIEPHPFSKDDFNLSNPVVHEIMRTGIEIMIS